MKKIVIADKFDLSGESWSPRIIAESIDLRRIRLNEGKTEKCASK